VVFQPDQILANQTNSSLALTNLQKSQSGGYAVVASNIAAQHQSGPVLTVFEVDFGDAPETWSIHHGAFDGRGIGLCGRLSGAARWLRTRRPAECHGTGDDLGRKR